MDCTDEREDSRPLYTKIRMRRCGTTLPTAPRWPRLHGIFVWQVDLSLHSPWSAGAWPLVLVDAAVRGALIALLLVLAIAMRRDRPQLPAGRVGVAMALGLCAQVISATPLFEQLVPRLWQAPWVAIAVGNAVLFWIFVSALFDDEFALRPVHIIAWSATALLSGINCAVLAHSSFNFAPFTMALQRAAPLVFSVLAVFAAARHWLSDLVEERRRLRTFVVVTGVAYTLAFLSARLASPRGQLVGLIALLDVASLLIIVLVLVLNRLRWGSLNLLTAIARQGPAQPHTVAQPAGAVADSFTPSQTVSGIALAPDPAEERLAQALERLMMVERAYRDENTSLSRLATRLKTPEYKLRRLINQRLGHRDFTAYINSYRLEAARSALIDPARRDLSVLTLALDAGFQSIGPFNRAFKAATGLTPTEFRKVNGADS